MKTIKILAVTLGMTALTAACVAQEDDETPDIYTYATYFYCPGGPLAPVDAIVANDAERLDGLVDDGTIASWGWLAHHTGGQWNRVFYYQAEGMDGLLDAFGPVQGGGSDDDNALFGRTCNSHDDYIWMAANGSQGEGRGDVGFSTYFVCDANREDRADEIVDEHVAPIFNGLVEDGKLISWGWQSHIVGGHFRKLATFTAPDVASLMAARGEAMMAMSGDDNPAFNELNEICGDHVDYIWNILNETP